MSFPRTPAIVQLLLCFAFAFFASCPPTAAQTAQSAAPWRYPAEPDLIEVIFSAESRVRLRGGALADLATDATRDLDRVLAPTNRWEWSRFCDVPEETMDEWQRNAEAAKGAPAFNLNNIYRLRLLDRAAAPDVWAVARSLEELPGVRSARPVPLPMPLPLPPDFQPQQGYEFPALPPPGGVDALYAWAQPGGDGTGVTVCDIEYSWNYSHNDVPKALGSQINSFVADPFLDTNHGTAVIGELVSRDNLPNWGTKGVCHGANLKTCGAYFGTPTPSWNVPGAIAVAIAALDPGDIILLEQQWDYAGGGTYVPIEWWTDVSPFPQSENAVFLAIQAAIDQGIHVVEAGGNGNVDTDTMVWFESGAVIVGAGGAYVGGSWPEGSLERLPFSSYGWRYDLQAWGEDVVTTGYGDLFNLEGVNRHYTGIFSGTSSASPIVAGAMACVQGRFMNYSGGGLVSPKTMRDILVATGQPQSAAVPGNIGPRPDILAALGALLGPNYNDFGDAPEGSLAYPDLGVIGGFPTCVGGPPGSFVQHGPSSLAYFGDFVDVELEGNGGYCPMFPPRYESDECFGDADAGLLWPPSFTIDPTLTVVPCDSTQTDCLGPACTVAQWGTNVDIQVTNNSAFPRYVAVLMDWNRNGIWGDSSTCSGSPVPELVLGAFPVPAGFSGPLSALSPPPFTIGPQSGYVWTRFSISESGISGGWNGQGQFQEGESSDFLLCVAPGPKEYGDAPESAPAYPGTGVIGVFPTCKTGGPAGYIEHASSGNLFLGSTVDLEFEGNAGNCPTFPPYNADECYQDGDAGAMFPSAYTIDGALNVVSCSSPIPPHLAFPCQQILWGTHLDIVVTNQTGNPAFLNVLVDWNQDGAWAGGSACTFGAANERALINFTVPSGYSGPFSLLAPPIMQGGPLEGYVWTRFTLTDVPIPLNWNGSGTFTDGETCDYLFRVVPDPTGAQVPPPVLRTRLTPGHPNPFQVQTTITAELASAGAIEVDVYDVTGRNVKTLFAGPRDAGRHAFLWDGRDAAGSAVAAGVYYVRMRLGKESYSVPVTLMR